MWKYCTRGEVSELSGIAEEKLADSWSDIVEELIDEHTGNAYGGTTTYTESYDGDGTDTIILKHSPVVSVTSLAVEGVSLQSTEYKVYANGYIRLVSYVGSPIDRAVGTSGSAFPVGQQNVEIVYVANDATVPAYVKLAAIFGITELALFSERGGSPGSLSVSRATQRAGESQGYYGMPVGIVRKIRAIISDAVGQKWRFS